MTEQKVVGFTGTRHGMTAEQKATVTNLVAEFEAVHHGDCLGADADMDTLAVEQDKYVVVHPPSDPKLRAWRKGDVICEPKPYLDRNRDLVDESDLLIATPAESTPQEKGGTWYTVNYARRQGKTVLIVWPDGSMEATAKDVVRGGR